MQKNLLKSLLRTKFKILVNQSLQSIESKSKFLYKARTLIYISRNIQHNNKRMLFLTSISIYRFHLFDVS